MKRIEIWRSTVAAAALSLAVVPTTTASAQDARSFETNEYRGGWQLGAINASSAYALGFTGQGVKVGVMDSGLDTRHPEFAGRMLEGYSFHYGVPISGNLYDFDTGTHGTHVSGIIAANRNGIAMHGVAYNAMIRPVTYDLGASTWDAMFAGAFRYVAGSGVSIVNNSIGINNCVYARVPPCNVTDYTAAGFVADNPALVAAMKETVAKDILMVFATGNEEQPAPDALGGMPYLVPELRNTWLAVGAVDSDLKLADFSNRCGVAADWCLVAPGVDVPSTYPLGSGPILPDYHADSGTSMATPVVSGVAALVKEAFPFFTAHDLQQVLLTTATPMGDRDAFGWGMVNAATAVKGYGQFVSHVTIDTKGLNATFGNDISGSGSLTKAGAGTLTLTGTNSYAGGTTVAGGTLAVNGTLASRVDVASAGTLRGTGAINAPLSVAGRLAPGNSPGTLTVAGPVTLAATSVSQFDIDGTGTGNGAGNHSRLVATGPTGTVAANGALVPVLRGITGSATNSYVAPLGARFDIIQASAGLTGSFQSLAQPGEGLARATRFDTLYATGGVALVVTPLAYGNLAANGVATTGNETVIGAALDGVRPTAGTRGNALFSGLYGTAAGDLPSALGQLTGEIHASARAVEIERGLMLRDAVGERIRGAFDGRADVSTERATAWTSAYGGSGSIDRSASAAGLDWDSANVLLGGDAPVGDASRIGLAAGFGRSTGEVDGQNARSRATHYDLLVYGATTVGAIEASAGVAHTWSKVDINRSPRFGTFAERLGASYDTGATQVFGELGYKATAGQFVLNPFLSGGYAALSGETFAEAGGSAALSGRTAARDLGVTVTGLRVSTAFELGAGRLSANAMVGWQHLYGDRGGVADVAFAGGSALAIGGSRLAEDALRIDLGADYAFSDRAKAGIGYRGAIGGSSISSAVRGDFKLAF